MCAGYSLLPGTEAKRAIRCVSLPSRDHPLPQAHKARSANGLLIIQLPLAIVHCHLSYIQCNVPYKGERPWSRSGGNAASTAVSAFRAPCGRIPRYTRKRTHHVKLIKLSRPWKSKTLTYHFHIPLTIPLLKLIKKWYIPLKYR